MKRIAAIHDISGFGKCSLTVALPIISAAGIECAIVPTAVLSTHTGGFTGFTYRDLTEDLDAFYKHWVSLGLTFDALYSGFLGSSDQIEIVSKMFAELSNENTKILVDPVMADNGQLYQIFTKDIITGMAQLCTKAHIIVPNITEACFIAGIEYQDGPYSEQFIRNLIDKLTNLLGKRDIVLTGVYFDQNQLGAAAFDSESQTVTYCMGERIEGYYHGTGDVFGSVLISAMTRGLSLNDAAQLAVDFVVACIKRAFAAGSPTREGVPFELELPMLISKLNK